MNKKNFLYFAGFRQVKIVGNFADYRQFKAGGPFLQTLSKSNLRVSLTNLGKSK